jgi:Xaa-Pro aminopeptidase
MKKTSEVFADRRQRLSEQMSASGGGVAVLFSGNEIMRNRDADYPFRWDSYFYYLTGFDEPESALVVIAPGGQQPAQSILFCREKNVERETWDGFRWGPEQACQEFGFDRGAPIESLDDQIVDLMANQNAIFYPLGASDSTDERVRRWLASVRAKGRSGITVPTQAHDLHGILDEMRLHKDAHELATMGRAAEISAGAHCRAMQTCQPGMFEYEVEAELLHEFRRCGSQFPAYGSIVASGANACVLHYRSNNRKMTDKDLLLIDAGCELDSYASDITRTFPVGGKFSSAQQELYEIVLASQHAAISATKPGNSFNDPHLAAVRVLVQGMLDTGLLSGGVDEVMESGAYSKFYMHRTSHWLGMDVHDCGDYRDRSAKATETDDAPPWRTLAPGMVLTIEPGIYVNADKDVPSKYHGIGIRIEDDAIVTDSGCEISTSGVPKEVAEIERLMADR